MPLAAQRLAYHTAQQYSSVRRLNLFQLTVYLRCYDAQYSGFYRRFVAHSTDVACCLVASEPALRRLAHSSVGFYYCFLQGSDLRSLLGLMRPPCSLKRLRWLSRLFLFSFGLRILLPCFGAEIAAENLCTAGL